MAGKVKFDFTYMDQLEHKNLWFIDILQDKELREYLLSQILKDSSQNDCTNLI